ncbi:MADS-box protein 04g005320-like isoform X2 [Salvia splendens]|uniref:MADS-box protein 04g005320-like isoform X2 n=1 Tax=Salvia splendens TaxID=180675 RepID=UPI001C273D5D|nr:MADS-box protein 04g005320-like isoform X2 [Salvia splendens]
MGRGKVEVKRIENKINRQVTFAKRRNGLLKKAYELSVLCDAEVALIIFSTKGKLYEFCSTSSMSKAVERYHRCSYGQTEANQSPNNDQLDTYEEYLKLKERVEALQQSQRHVLGEDLSQLGINELDQLEHILDGTLKQTRSRKNHSLCDKLSDLQQKERSLLELNAALMNKQLEGNSAPLESTWQLQHDLNAQYQHPYFLDPNYTPEIRHDSIVAADNVRDNGNEHLQWGGQGAASPLWGSGTSEDGREVV